MKRKFVLLYVLLITLWLSNPAISQVGDYYNGITTSSVDFVDDLKARVRSPYTKISYDQFDETNVANFASYDKGDGTRGVRCVYSYYEHVYTPTFAWGTMSREHTFCYSWMPSHGSTSTNEYSDQHHLFPTHQNGANGVRSNHPLGIVTTVTSSFLEGKYGKDANGNNVYEPRDQHKGDAARAILYMLLRYDDVNGNNWDMNWLNNVKLPALNEAPQNLNLLLTWHLEDPPDAWEIARNDYIHSIQKNRNPFVDHPDYVDYINFYDMSYNSPTTNTIVYFYSSGATLYESAGVCTLSVAIVNADPDIPTTVDIALISGDAADLGGYTTTTLTFPAGSSSRQLLVVNITEDAIPEDDEEFVFKLQNITGNSTVEVGDPSEFRLKIIDNERRLIISEYSDADGTGNFIYEFVEIYNEKNTNIDISGYVIRQMESTQSFTIPEETIINAKGFLVLARNSEKGAFETFWSTTLGSNVVFINSGNRLPQINGAEQYRLEDHTAFVIDPDDGGSYSINPITEGKRVYRINMGNTESDWKVVNWNTATPGALDGDQALPVELQNFQGSVIGNDVNLRWKTVTEINNYGFEVERSEKRDERSEKWEKIGFVAGNGTSNSVKEYSFTDDISKHLSLYHPKDPLDNLNLTLSYRLKQIDNDGSYTYSNEITVETMKATSLPIEFTLYNNYPNPFNPSTTIKFGIPKESKVILEVFNVLGERVVTLVNKEMTEGYHEVKFNGASLPGGVYIYKLAADGFSATKKLVLMK